MTQDRQSLFAVARLFRSRYSTSATSSAARRFSISAIASLRAAATSAVRFLLLKQRLAYLAATRRRRANTSSAIRIKCSRIHADSAPRVFRCFARAIYQRQMLMLCVRLKELGGFCTCAAVRVIRIRN
jgi:hypothetical protein